MQRNVTVVAGDPGVSVRLYYPAEPLQSYATFYYFVDSAGPLEDFLYPEWGNVRFTLGGDWRAEAAGELWGRPTGAALFGATDRAARLTSGGGRLVGFGLTPLGWERFFDDPADALANRATDLGDRLGVAGEELVAELARHREDAEGVALFDRVLAARLATRPGNSAIAVVIDRVLRERPHDVEVFAERAGVSSRTLGRACHRLFGFAPKRLLRRQRFLDTLGDIRVADRPEFGTMIDPEYFDQSHFNREFREFMGLSPGAYLACPRPLMRSVAEVQAAAGIPLSFRLPPQPGGGPGGSPAGC